MRLKPARWSELHSRDERTVARIERIARNDTIWGGAKAMVLSKRLADMGGQDVGWVVASVYCASTGKPHPDYSAWECPECGSAHLGQENAYKCCQNTED